MSEGMTVTVLPIHRHARRSQGVPATVLEIPTESRGRARVRFKGGGTARVPISRLVKP